MSERRPAVEATTKRILVALIIWNLIDIAIHIGVDKVEIVRVSANVVLILAAAAILLGRAGAHPAHPLVLAVILFIVLNVGFIIGNGPAVPMTIFIVISVVLAGAAIQRLRPPAADRRISFRRS